MGTESDNAKGVSTLPDAFRISTRRPSAFRSGREGDEARGTAGAAGTDPPEDRPDVPADRRADAIGVAPAALRREPARVPA